MRIHGIDKLRGLAIIFMIVDHLAIMLGPDGQPFRFTIGRLAMPIFFLIAGIFVTRITWRHGLILGIGIALPMYADWIDRPNVLVIYVVGACILAGIHRLPHHWHFSSKMITAVVFLTLSANGYDKFPQSFAIGTLIAIMMIGSITPRNDFRRLGDYIPLIPGFSFVGRHPLSIYVGHILILESLRRVV
jgi:peptidoglycan/LPS O-acetylase OafA/YrhL